MRAKQNYKIEQDDEFEPDELAGNGDEQKEI